MIKPLSDNPEHIQALCVRLDLGSLAGEPGRVYGGFHHKMWRFDTDRGIYAIKQLSSDTDLADRATLDHYNSTEAVAEAFTSHGIAAIFAIRGRSGYVQVLDNVGYLVYPWTSAVALHKHQITQPHALEVARILAKMHRANIVVPGLKEKQADIHPRQKILDLISRAGECNIPRTQDLNEHLPAFLAIVDAQAEGLKTLEQHVVISHGDLDHKNVLWDAAGLPVIIDWESARRLNPTYEIMMESLDWSGITGRFDYSLFEKMISVYRDSVGGIENNSLQASLHCILGDWVNWLMYNVARSLDPEDLEQRTIGTEQIDLVLPTILHLRQLVPELLSLARERG